MNFEKIKTNTCCGSETVVYILEKPIDSNTAKNFQLFKELTHFTANGILYLESDFAIITGNIGQNKLTLKFKDKNTNNTQNIVEEILHNL